MPDALRDARQPRSTSSRSTAPSPSRWTRTPAPRALGADWATFTCASSARFLHAPRARSTGPRLASIGPVTSAALRELGFEPDVEAADHTPDGLVAALVAAAGG